MNSKIALLVILMSVMSGCCRAKCRDGDEKYNGMPERKKENGRIWGKGGSNFLIIDGCGHLIPTWTVYDNVFKNRSCIRGEDIWIDSFCICAPLDESTQIGHFHGAEGNYLWTGGHKYWIPSNEMADKYCFNLGMLQEWPEEDKNNPVPEGVHLY